MCVVSDEDAVRALLAETAAAVALKEEQQHEQKQRRREQQNDPRKRPRSQQQQQEQLEPPRDNYYGPAAAAHPQQEGVVGVTNETSPDVEVEKKKPDFGLSGALAKDQSGTGGSNVYRGVLLKFQEPPEARTPTVPWRLYVFRGDEPMQDTLHVSKQSAYLFARNADIADIVLSHPSSSAQHAVLQYRAVPSKETGKLICQPYLMDLESTNGTFINGVRIDPARYYQLKKGDVLKFGASTREYVLLTANTKSLK